MRCVFFIVSCIFSATSLHSQTIDEIVKRFISVNEVQFEYIGFNKSNLYKDFLTLTQKADSNKLVELTNHKNATVRCYAGWGLIDKKYPKLDVVYQNFLNNDSDVVTVHLDIVSDDKISSNFYHRYWNSLKFKDRESNSMLIKLDSISLYNPNTDWLLVLRALENRIYSKKYNAQIEYLAFEKHNLDAIFYLSNWFKAEYITRLKPALVEYLKKTNFKNKGVDRYYQVVNELLKFNDEAIEKIIVDKLRKDKHWEHSRQRFVELLHDYSIFEVDLQ